MKKYILNKFLTYFLKNYICIITEDDFLQIKTLKISPSKAKEVLHRQGKPLSESRQKNFKTDAKILKQSDLYNMLMNELRVKAENDILNKSKTMDDVIIGKAILYIVKLIQDKVERISDL